MTAALQIKELNVTFDTHDGEVVAVNNFSINVARGETLAIVGESGSGKTQTFLGIMGLLAKNGKISGQALLNDVDLLSLSARGLDDYRGSHITMVFQDPMTALNPGMRILRQLTETLIKHKNMSEKEAAKVALRMLEKVGIPEAEKRIRAYPHELSGGMRQRVMIAMALLCEPTVLIADEPTTALDVTIQAQILDLFADLKTDFNTALVMITHDLGVVAGLADRIAVMYAGRIVEEGGVLEVFENPLHPYTQALLESTPRVDLDGADINPIPGRPPNLQRLPIGCAFADRCRYAEEQCLQTRPELKPMGNQRRAACFRSNELIETAS